MYKLTGLVVCLQINAFVVDAMVVVQIRVNVHVKVQLFKEECVEIQYITCRGQMQTRYFLGQIYI